MLEIIEHQIEHRLGDIIKEEVYRNLAKDILFDIELAGMLPPEAKSVSPGGAFYRDNRWEEE